MLTRIPHRYEALARQSVRLGQQTDIASLTEMSLQKSAKKRGSFRHSNHAELVRHARSQLDIPVADNCVLVSSARELPVLPSGYESQGPSEKRRKSLRNKYMWPFTGAYPISWHCKLRFASGYRIHVARAHTRTRDSLSHSRINTHRTTQTRHLRRTAASSWYFV